MSNIKNIVIVGGGSSGWFSAAFLKKRFPSIDITLVESPNIPTVGVGESTLGSINVFLQSLDLKDEDWMEECNATYKLAIKFRDFFKKGETFYYPFGTKDTTNCINGISDWFWKKALYPETDTLNFYDSFYSQMELIYQNKINTNEKGMLRNFPFDSESAYHMDAAAFGEYLKKNLCESNGVRFIEKNVVDVVVSEQGIDRLIFDDQTSVTADLFIDCTGFRSLLLEQHLGVKFNSYSDWLPNNRAWTCHVPYHDKNLEIENVTNCTAIDNGWVWNIPLYHRIGTGYVYCNKFITDEDALQQFKDYLDSDQMTYYNPMRSKDLNFRQVVIKNGVHDVAWFKNCVAVGLSYGFIEPLESTGLLSVQEILYLIAKTLDCETVNKFHIDSFNYTINRIMDGFKLFVAYHYVLSSRRDTPYWRHVTENICMDRRLSDPDFLDVPYETTTVMEKILRVHNLSSSDGGFPDVFVGMHHFPITKTLALHQEIRNKLTKEPHIYYNPKIEQYWAAKKKIGRSVADNSLSHYEYLKQHIYGGKA